MAFNQLQQVTANFRYFPFASHTSSSPIIQKSREKFPPRNESQRLTRPAAVEERHRFMSGLLEWNEEERCQRLMFTIPIQPGSHCKWSSTKYSCWQRCVALVSFNDTLDYHLSAIRLATQYVAFVHVEFNDGLAFNYEYFLSEPCSSDSTCFTIMPPCVVCGTLLIYIHQETHTSCTLEYWYR